MRGIKLGIWALFTVFVIILAVALVNQNSEPTAIALFSYVSEPMPKYLILIIAFVLGAIFSSLFFIVELIVLESRCLRLKRLNTKLERAITKENPTSPMNKLPGAEIVVSSGDTSDV
ncbi:MAG TPA: LapA family protein [Bdellovibrionota bacterium]|jgi:uncharacterized integral membrane protein|nr:LapA family protein [Bdellovibrionota bacterium]